MPRINFVDEMNTRGQIDLADVKPGDTVRFEREYVHPFKPYITVVEGAVGEVLQTETQLPAIALRVHGTLSTKGGGYETAERSIAVKPEVVVLLVDSGDSRIGNNRVMREVQAVNKPYAIGERLRFRGRQTYDMDNKHVMPDVYAVDGYHSDGSIELVGEQRKKRYRFVPDDVIELVSQGFVDEWDDDANDFGTVDEATEIDLDLIEEHELDDFDAARKLAGMDPGLWEVVKTGIPAIAGGDFVDRAKATAALVAWARQLVHGGDDRAAKAASSIYAAIDAIESMSDERWAVELSDRV